MPLEPHMITAYSSGEKKNKKPFLIIEDAFQELRNAYNWRERIKRREGIKLVGRLRRCYTTDQTLSTQATGANYVNADILADANIDVRAPATGVAETFAEIDPGTVQVTVNGNVFTDATSDGLLTSGDNSTGEINYVTGQLDLDFDPILVGNHNVDVQFCYYPSLPAMGIVQRERAEINSEQTLIFDRKYVYAYTGNEFDAVSAVVWAGGDADFFWGGNYRGSGEADRLLFVTNFTDPGVDGNNRIRYTQNAVNWTDFTPAVAGTTVTGESSATAQPSGTTPVNFNLANTPVIPGTVVIRAEDTAGNVIGFRDQLGVYPAGTLNGSPSTHSGTIDYSTGAVTLNFNPANWSNPNTFNVISNYQYETSFLFQARLIIPYYGRLLFLNVYEGATDAGSTNFFNRCRYSQIGNPLERNALVHTTIGKGGFIDAPTNEAITSVRFYKNTLIVFFESTTWELRYTGDVGLPFIWERISSDFGSESTHSTILFDKGILAVGDKAIVASSGSNVERIDLDIPSQVFELNNINNGKERVFGERDFFKEVAYWTFTSGSLGNTFPNRVLLYNYRNNTWATYRDNVTCFGILNTPRGDSWDLPISWDSETSWDNQYPQEFPMIISGNQQGWIHWYQYETDPETGADALTDMMEHESLSIFGITLSNTNDISLNIPNHNLEALEIIYITGLQFINAAGTATVATDLNNKFYQVTLTDANNVTLQQWNEANNSFVNTDHDTLGFTPDPDNADIYVGNGRVALMQNISIITKDFNPYQQIGKQIKHSYTDFQLDTSPNSSLSLDLILNANDNLSGSGVIGNTEVATTTAQHGVITGGEQSNPCRITAPNHGLQTGRRITIAGVNGMTELNGNQYLVTKINENTFDLQGTDASGFTVYTNGGYWYSIDNQFYVPGSNYAWHRFYSTCFGQYLTYRLYFNNAQMCQLHTHNSGVELNAMTLYTQPGGRLT